jgi:hypothetical protein
MGGGLYEVVSQKCDDVGEGCATPVPRWRPDSAIRLFKTYLKHADVRDTNEIVLLHRNLQNTV